MIGFEWYGRRIFVVVLAVLAALAVMANGKRVRHY